MRGDRRQPLYRKVNTTAHGVRHRFGGDARDGRAAAKKERGEDAPVRASMHGRVRRGRDYTPLFRFLQSRVGRPWAEVHSEAVARLDDPAPIAWLVAPGREAGRPRVLIGESSWWRGLFVDDAGLLQLVAPELDAADLEPDCACCTHTLDGVRFGRPFPG